MKYHRYAIPFAIAATLFLGGCMPSFTHSKSTISITVNPENLNSSNPANTERYIVVSFWEYPTVNQSPGKIVIKDVFVTDKSTFAINFPLTGYWVVWTPVFGTQHLAPEPGIMVFHADYFPAKGIGVTDSKYGICCQKPESKHTFYPKLIESEQDFREKYSKIQNIRIFFLDFIDNTKILRRKLDQCKGITAEEKKMVFEKLTQAANALGISHSI